MQWLRGMLPVATVIAIAVAAPRASAQSARHEIVRGHVLSDSGGPVAGATVVATMTSSAEPRTTTSDARGAYAIDFPAGTGDYALVATATGYRPASMHVVRGADSIITADVRLARDVTRLPTVVSRAARAVPDRDPASYAAGGAESMTVPQNAARRIGPDVAGDLAAIAATLPGVSVVPGGISVLGLPPTQNTITLGGLAFAGSDIPRDAATRVRVQSSTYDPSNGWFSGAQTNVDLVIGDQFTSRTAHVSADAPALEYDDPLSARLGQRFTNVAASLGGEGQLVDDRWAYNYGIQGGRRAASLSSSLVNGDADLLQHAGVSRDSVARLLSLLGAQGILPSVGGVPNGVVTENVSAIGRIDHAPYDWNTLRYNPATYGLQGYAKWSRTDALGVIPTGTPAHGGTSTLGIAALTALYTRQFAGGALADLRTGVTVTRNDTRPYLAVPDGRVLVASTFADGVGGLANLQFGGNSTLGSTQRNVRWESSGQLQLYPAGAARHRVKIAGDVRFDAYTQDLAANQLGTFAYSSLSDLAANRPASFTRTLVSPRRTGGVWNAFASIGDLWRASPRLQLLYGVRLEGNVYIKAPTPNPALAALGVRNDAAPNTFAVIPRLGFNFQPGAGRIVRGGIGAFRNLLDASLLAAPGVSTGLAGGTVKLACVGSAVPTPDWTAFEAGTANIPAQCVGTNGVLNDVAPDVRYVDPSYGPTRSWRSNLGYQSSIGRNVYSIDLIGSLNLDQPGTFDRNFSGVPQFTLGDEGRPVYVPASSIVAATGALSGAGARRVPTFGRVVDVVSDLRSRSGQMVLTLRPFIPGSLQPYLGDVSIAYTLTSIRAQQRGFDGGSAGDPTRRDWARGDLDARHTLVAQWVTRPFRDRRVVAFVYGRLQSGLPFTPMVAGDVNGDGLVNDRAFVFSPSQAGDTATANGMRALLASAPRAARDCLRSQLGRLSARNSCEGPWTSTLNVGVRLDGQTLLHTPRMDVTLNLTNPLGGLDQLLHGADRLHGWGAPATPDPTLLTVRGFDPTANRFLYTVNPRFGSTSPSLSTVRAPFRLTLDVQLDLGPSMSMQQLDRWLRPGRSGRTGTRLPASELTRRYERTVPDPYAEVLTQSDSLLLSPDEQTRLQDARAAYRATVDSIWNDLGAYLGGLPDHYDFDAAVRRADRTVDEVWEITRRSIHRDFAAILAPAQLPLLTGYAGFLFRSPTPVHVRLSPRGG